jgi:hypothetical protein
MKRLQKKGVLLSYIGDGGESCAGGKNRLAFFALATLNVLKILC